MTEIFMISLANSLLIAQKISFCFKYILFSFLNRCGLKKRNCVYDGEER
jgi:hypothetical protein